MNLLTLNADEVRSNLEPYRDYKIYTKWGYSCFANEIIDHLSEIKQFAASKFIKLTEEMVYHSHKQKQYPFSICLKKKDEKIDFIILFGRDGEGATKKSRLLYDLITGDIISRVMRRDPSYDIEREIQHNIRFNGNDGRIGLPKLLSTSDIKSGEPALYLKYYFCSLEDISLYNYNLSPRHCYHLILQLAEGVNMIHSAGYAHMDLKLGNMRANFDLKNPDSVEAVVLDFDRMRSKEDPDQIMLSKAKSSLALSLDHFSLADRAVGFDIWALGQAFGQIYFFDAHSYYSKPKENEHFAEWKKRINLEVEDNSLVEIFIQMQYFTIPDLNFYLQKLKRCEDEVLKDQNSWLKKEASKASESEDDVEKVSDISCVNSTESPIENTTEYRKQMRKRFKISAEFGNPLSQFEMYQNSETQAKKIKWLRMAAANGHEPAEKVLEDLGIRLWG